LLFRASVPVDQCCTFSGVTQSIYFAPFWGNWRRELPRRAEGHKRSIIACSVAAYYNACTGAGFPMKGMFQPVQLIFILLIVLIWFGPEKLPDLGRGLRRAVDEFRRALLCGLRFRGALFIAKGVDPSVGRDVGDMLPDENARRSRVWLRWLLAILIGNRLYIASSQFLPAEARLDAGSSPGLPALIDLWFCLFSFGVLCLVAGAGKPFQWPLAKLALGTRVSAECTSGGQQ
jgi:TatA/E family protein of Tat protein translocase